MLSRILFDAFLFLLPFALYGAYIWLLRRRLKQDPAWRDTPWTWLTIAGLVLVALSFVVLRLAEGDNGPAVVVPAHIEDGRLVPSQVKP